MMAKIGLYGKEKTIKSITSKLKKAPTFETVKVAVATNTNIEAQTKEGAIKQLEQRLERKDEQTLRMIDRAITEDTKKRRV
jgi:RNase H-fold protein (predicted Holliday junction resolvase)